MMWTSFATERSLRLLISINGIRIDLKKVKVIINWQEPENVKNIRAFIGFTNFY
ncbi:uncharacterized protein K441DRAFT_722754 [Cenococcum geophilum 1.58]|uniref:uncharacterized protein n=1 Tax=Cenococcum geophilum 1.58 TaxID=794803 RepID=UPI00358E8AE1|nr:hypothetical protein K441DRAFT_722754 [Cenococcum geophilum 1.58]